MVRKILAFLAGLIAAIAITIVAQLLNALIFGVPRIQPGDTEALAAYVAGLPAAAFILVAAGYAVGYFVGGFLMRKISRWDSIVLPALLGIFGTAGWTLNISKIPHPTWMIVLGFFCFLPFAFLGYRLAGSGDAAS